MNSHFLKTGEILSPEEVSKKERFYLPYLKVKEASALPVVVGVPIQTTLSIASSRNECDELLNIFDDKKYVLSCCNYVRIIIIIC